VSGKQTLPRQSRWAALPEQGCSLPSHDVTGYLQKVVWRLRTFCAAKLSSRHTAGSRVGEHFAIDMCALMQEEKSAWLGMQENH